MTVFKCKMCGGALNIENGESVVTCEYCDTKQTVPHVDNEMKIKLFSRANRLRTACQFDSARNVYEDIIKNFPEEAEAYWGLILCKYGIEYVDDPQTGRKIPTCHRSSFESVMDDSDFEQTLENADSVARKVYREEAKKIEEIRKGILEVSSKEEPFDIFICYKETDENGERTVDSVIAQDIYDMLTENGYRVFFSRVTLEDKLGQAYEPYIFAALNSAKIMLAVGTDYEYYDAAWVKNEWSRYLELISKGEKKVLIPCYKDLDAYDIPKQFRHLQAQDMGKVGAMQDLLRGIKKIFPKGTPTEPNTQFPVVANTQVTQNMVQPLLTRVFMFLEDGDFTSADQYCEKVLDMNPMCAEAYLGKALSYLKLKRIQEIYNIDNVMVEDMPNIKKAINFGNTELKNKLEIALKVNKENFKIKQQQLQIKREQEQKEFLFQQEQARKEKIYQDGEILLGQHIGNLTIVELERKINECLSAIKNIKELGDYKDSDDLIKKINEKIQSYRTKIDEINKYNYKKSWLSNALFVRTKMYKEYKENTGKLKEKFHSSNDDYEISSVIYSLEKEIDELKKQILTKSAILDNMGKFDFSRKSKCQKEIDEMNVEFESKKSQLDQIIQQQSDREYNFIQENKKHLFDELTQKYPIPKMPDDLDGSIQDKVYAVIIGTYSILTSSDIINVIGASDMDKKVERALKVLTNQRYIAYIDGNGYVGADIANIYY